MAGGLLAPRIVFTIANVVFLGVFLQPPCHMVRATLDAIWERVKQFLSLSSSVFLNFVGSVPFASLFAIPQPFLFCFSYFVSSVSFASLFVFSQPFLFCFSYFFPSFPFASLFAIPPAFPFA
jgi:hypothetical protein